MTVPAKPRSELRDNTEAPDSRSKVGISKTKYIEELEDKLRISEGKNATLETKLNTLNDKYWELYDRESESRISNRPLQAKLNTSAGMLSELEMKYRISEDSKAALQTELNTAVEYIKELEKKDHSDRVVPLKSTQEFVAAARQGSAQSSIERNTMEAKSDDMKRQKIIHELTQTTQNQQAIYERLLKV